MYLTPESIEALEILAEEAAEVVQITMKILRHGLESKHPTGDYRNWEELERELGDLQALIRILGRLGIVSFPRISLACNDKLERLPNWVHYISLEVIKDAR